MPSFDLPATPPASLPAEPRPLDALFPLVYAELRRLAHVRLRRERPDHTLDTTALVHDAYLRLADQAHAAGADRARLLSLAALAMRRVLVDHARKHRAEKRGGGGTPLRLEDAAIAAPDRADTLVALDEALSRLERVAPRLCRVVECRFFSGLSEAETAEVLRVTTRTVQRDWVKAKAWLYRELGA